MNAMVDRSGHAMQTLITTEAERMKAVLDDGISNIRKLCYIGQLRDPELLCFIEKSLAIRSSDDCRGLQGEEKQTSRAIAALNNLWDVEESVLLHGNQQNTLQHKCIHTLFRELNKDTKIDELLLTFAKTNRKEIISKPRSIAAVTPEIGEEESATQHPNENAECPPLLQLEDQLEKFAYIIFNQTNTPAEEHEAAKTMLEGLEKRERLMKEEEFSLEEEIAVNIEEHEGYRNDVQSLIETAKKELQELTYVNCIEVASARSKAAERIAKAKTEHERCIEELEKEIEDVTGRLSECMKAHSDMKARANENRSKALTDLDCNLQRYETVVRETSSAIENTRKQLKKEKRECLQLSDYFDPIDADAIATKEEEIILDQVREKVRSGENILHSAATKLQAVYRGYKERKRLKAVRKKRGGKKGSKGKVKGSTKKESKVRKTTTKKSTTK